MILEQIRPNSMPNSSFRHLCHHVYMLQLHIPTMLISSMEHLDQHSTSDCGTRGQLPMSFSYNLLNMLLADGQTANFESYLILKQWQQPQQVREGKRVKHYAK